MNIRWQDSEGVQIEDGIQRGMRRRALSRDWRAKSAATVNGTRRARDTSSMMNTEPLAVSTKRFIPRWINVRWPPTPRGQSEPKTKKITSGLLEARLR